MKIKILNVKCCTPIILTTEWQWLSFNINSSKTSITLKKAKIIVENSVVTADWIKHVSAGWTVTRVLGTTRGVRCG